MIQLPQVSPPAAGLNFTTCVPAACSYAARARKIRNKPTKNTNQLSKLREGMAALREENRKLQVRGAHQVVKSLFASHVAGPLLGLHSHHCGKSGRSKCCQLTFQPAR